MRATDSDASSAASCTIGYSKLSLDVVVARLEVRGDGLLLGRGKGVRELYENSMYKSP